MRKSDGVLLAYDVTRKESLEEVSWWLDFANRSGAESAFKLLVGCKADRGEERQISVAEGEVKYTDPIISLPPTHLYMSDLEICQCSEFNELIGTGPKAKNWLH